VASPLFTHKPLSTYQSLHSSMQSAIIRLGVVLVSSISTQIHELAVSCR
jgi:hypothetical protein